MPWPLYLQYPLDRRLGQSQNQSGTGGKEKESLSGIDPWS